ncbi:hypothetical protein AB0D09_00470 [Streptomyces sp. NPDC049097]|uniref:hypothetical protein n=1 Tax=unclassified Streptomyces TaxID=2593676 RepID=UPI0033CB0FF3
MARHGMRGMARGAAIVVAAAAVLSGCSDGGASGTASQAASAATKAASAAASAASEAGAALASASAEAGRKLDRIKGGAHAKADVKLGATADGSGGHKAAPVTVTNPTSESRTYAVQVNFKNTKGDLLDTVVVTVPDVPGGGSKNATALSNRGLSGAVTTSVARAVRY